MRPKTYNKPVHLSQAYKNQLSRPVSADIAQTIGMGDDEVPPNYAEAIAFVVANRAIGRVKDAEICFKAITELRETTEGKTPEKLIAAGTNSELLALASLMKGEPAPPDADLTEEDAPTEDAEANFHEGTSQEE